MEFPKESITRITIQPDLEENNSSKYPGKNNLSERRKKVTSRLPNLLQRRLGNDQNMMRELHRYQNIMFLTLLPSISGQNPSPSTPSQDPISGENKMSNLPTSQSTPLPSATRLRRNSMFERPNNFPLVRRENSLEEKQKFVNTSGNKSVLDKQEINRDLHILSPIQSTSVGEIPLTDHEKRRNKSGKVRDLLRTSLHMPTALDENDIDLTTLTALYLENRKKLFGEEWSLRKDIKGSQRMDAGTPGILKPRKLTPLEGKSSEPGISHLPDLRSQSPQSYHHRAVIDSETPIQMPTPGGLHLSAHFNLNTFSSVNDRSIRPRKGNRKSDLRRLSSLDESVHNVDEETPIQRTNSAPDISKKGKVILNNKEPSSSPPLVTPARANTPTELGKSSHIIRPQLIGGSIATCSPEQSFNISKTKASSEIENKKVKEKQKSSFDDQTPSLKLKPQSLGQPFKSSLPTVVPSSILEEGNSSKIFPVKLNSRPSKGSKLRLLPLDKPVKKHSVP